jgi:cytochrome c
MKSTLMGIIAVTALLATTIVLAADMPEIAKKNGCTACHAIDKKMVGPSFIDVAKKYKGDSKAAAHLDTKIAKGGSGVWGSMPMPASPKLSDAERKELVTFILGLAK